MVTYSDYKQFVWDLWNPDIRDSSDRVLYLVTKLVNEIIEFIEEPSSDEAGDILWYLTNLDNIFGFDASTIIKHYHPSVHLNSEFLLFRANNILGKMLKSWFHDKPYNFSDITNDIAHLYKGYLEVLLSYEMSITEVMEYNHSKLSARHGTQYNAGFYQK